MHATPERVRLDRGEPVGSLAGGWAGENERWRVGRRVVNQQAVGVQEATNVLSWSKAADEQDMPLIRPRLPGSPVWSAVVADGDPVGGIPSRRVTSEPVKCEGTMTWSASRACLMTRLG